MLRFRDELLAEHASDHVDLVFSNAGIGGGGSFVNDRREDWERTFAVDWWGVYYCARVFLPLLIASGDGVLVNTSSVNGFWATLGPGMPNTAYCTAKFAVKGFTEALIEDLRTNAPQVRVAVVMPGHVGTDIVANSMRAHGVVPESGPLNDIQQERRAELIRRGVLAEGATADEMRQMLEKMSADFREARRSARPGRPPSSWTGCDRAPGGSSSARMPRASTWPCARIRKTPTTTPRWPAWRPPLSGNPGAAAGGRRYRDRHAACWHDDDAGAVPGALIAGSIQKKPRGERPRGFGFPVVARPVTCPGRPPWMTTASSAVSSGCSTPTR